MSLTARKFSYLFLVLGLLTPFATSWYLTQARDEYLARTGFEPDGMGLFGIALLGALCMFGLFVLAAFCGIRAFRRVTAPRPLIRKIEVATLCVPLVVLVTLGFGFWYISNHPG